MYEEKVLDLIEYMENTNNKDMEAITEKINSLNNYLSSYNNNVNIKIKKALDNVLKLNDEKYHTLGNADYVDIYKVKDEEGHIKYTYSYKKHDGIAIREYCCRHTNTIDLLKLKELLNNEKAVIKLKTLVGFDEFIESLNTLCNTIPISNFDRNKEYKMPMLLNNIEQKAVDKAIHNSNGIKSIEKVLLDYDFKRTRLMKNEFSDLADRNYNTELTQILNTIIIRNHTDEITKEGNTLIKDLKKTKKVYKEKEEEVNNILSKWLMLDMI